MGNDNEINEFMPLREVVFLTLRKAILKGELQPGERLMEIQLANKLGVSDVLEVRKSLEMLAIHKACERMTEEDMQAMRRAAEKFERLVNQKGNDVTALAEADVEFHDTIYSGTRNRRLIQILGNLREQMYRFRIEYLKDHEIRKTLVEEHREIMCAVEQRDIDNAVRLIGDHIDRQQNVIKTSIESMED